MQQWRYGETSSLVKIPRKLRRRRTSKAISPNSLRGSGRDVPRHNLRPFTNGMDAQTSLGKKTSKILVFYYFLAMIL